MPSLYTGLSVFVHRPVSLCTQARQSLYTGLSVFVHRPVSLCTQACQSLYTGLSVFVHRPVSLYCLPGATDYFSQHQSSLLAASWCSLLHSIDSDDKLHTQRDESFKRATVAHSTGMMKRLLTG